MWGALCSLVLPTQLARPTMAPPIHIPSSSILSTERGRASLKGLAPPRPWGPIWPPNPGGSCLSHSAWRSCHCITPVMATQPLLPEQQCPAPPVHAEAQVRMALALVMGAQVNGRPEQGTLQVPPPGRAEPARWKQVPPSPTKAFYSQTPSLLPSERHRGPGAPSGCMRACGPETRAPPKPSHSKRPPQNTSVPLCPPLCSAVCFPLGVTLKAT